MNYLNTTTVQEREGYFADVHSYSTAEIETMIFHGEYSPEVQQIEVAEPAGEYRLIGDEVMKIDRVNLPPGVLPPE